MSSGQVFRGGNMSAKGSVKRCSAGSTSSVGGGSLSSRRRFDGGAMSATDITASVPAGSQFSEGDAMSCGCCDAKR